LLETMIKNISNKNDLIRCVTVIRDSFKTITAEFGLNEKNCPTHPAFITLKQLKDLKKKGVKLFGIFENDEQIGFVAIEKPASPHITWKSWRFCPSTGMKGIAGTL
jgi:diamine N-acetyltransferase